MKNFPQTYEPTGSMSILEQFVGLKNFMNNKLNSNEYVKTTEQTLTEEQKEKVRENIGVGSSNVIDNVNSTSTTESLSANQGRVLNEKIDSNVNELQQAIDAIGAEHPVGSLYYCVYGSNSPASVFGGTWEKIAENVVIPLGGLVPVVNDGPSTGNPSLGVGQINTTKTYDLKVSSNLVYIANNSSGLSSAILKTDLSQATTKISGVDIWSRVG